MAVTRRILLFLIPLAFIALSVWVQTRPHLSVASVVLSFSHTQNEFGWPIRIAKHDKETVFNRNWMSNGRPLNERITRDEINWKTGPLLTCIAANLLVVAAIIHLVFVYVRTASPKLRNVGAAGVLISMLAVVGAIAIWQFLDFPHPESRGIYWYYTYAIVAIFAAFLSPLTIWLQSKNAKPIVG